MCGQVGVLFGSSERKLEEQSYLKWVFTYLLLLSQRRGPHATGVGWMNRNGEHSIFKRPIPAFKFVKEKGFVDALAGVDNSTTWLAGHTRWPTCGSHLNNRNNHPIVVGNRLVTTHNGTILNADALFERFNMHRSAEVDSEIIPRMADDTLCDGCIDIPAFKERLALCRGQISAVVASKLDPKNVLLIKGNMPLELRYHPEHNVVVYASDPVYLDAALASELGWQKIETEPMRIMRFNVDDLPRFESTPFKLSENRR